jgi:hypothetical protein
MVDNIEITLGWHKRRKAFSYTVYVALPVKAVGRNLRFTFSLKLS